MAGKKKKSGSSKKNKASRQHNAPPPDVNEVISQADLAMETANFEQALQLYHYAVITLRKTLSSSSDKGEAENSALLALAKVLSKFGEAKISAGDRDGGRSDFNEALLLLESSDDQEDMVTNEEDRKALENEEWKEVKAGLYMYIGQLSNGSDALNYFKKSITSLKEYIVILEAQEIKLRNESSTVDENGVKSVAFDSLTEMRRQLCAACCAAAELYLTDLCDKVGAEKKCEAYLKEALQIDDNESTKDATQAMANLRLSQCRGMEAIPYILKVYSEMKETVSAIADFVGLGCSENASTNPNISDDGSEAKELSNDVVQAATNKLPDFDFRCQTAKILLECASVIEENTDLEKNDKETDMIEDTEQKPYCIEAAIQVLGSLIAENDESIEVWYLLGCAFESMTPKNVESAKYYWETALKMLEKEKKELDQEMSIRRKFRRYEICN